MRQRPKEKAAANASSETSRRRIRETSAVHERVTGERYRTLVRLASHRPRGLIGRLWQSAEIIYLRCRGRFPADVIRQLEEILNREGNSAALRFIAQIMSAYPEQRSERRR